MTPPAHRIGGVPPVPYAWFDADGCLRPGGAGLAEILG